MTRVRIVRGQSGRILVTRDDTAHVIRHAASVWSDRARAAPAQFVHTVGASYREFGSRVRAELVAALAHPAGVRVDCWDAAVLRREVLAAAQPAQVVSLDPLVTDGESLRVSRGFLPGGRHLVGLVSRPGAPTLAVQLADLAAGVGPSGCVVIEDDIFTGHTVNAVATMLAVAGVRVLRAVCGIRVRHADAVSPSVALTAAVEYRVLEGGRDLVQVADPRSFLFGMDGLVVRSPGDRWGRVPYWSPFVDVRERLGVPDRRVAAFTAGLIDANIQFFTRLGTEFGDEVRLADLPFSPKLNDPGQSAIDYLRSVRLGPHPDLDLLSAT